MDELDLKLISALRVNSRTPVAVLAREFGVNRSTIAARIEQLVDAGVIEAFTLRLSNDVDRDALRAITMLITEPNEGQDVVRTIRGFPEVEQLHSTIGVWDLIVQLRAHTMSGLDIAIERIRATPGVTSTQTSLLFNSLTRT